ncbi:hypothetical protein JL721_5263 [Aureococcus anophagefferens]|nr:hypothetical protein JL721_5263 [Aureococcus anophagefferens]
MSTEEPVDPETPAVTPKSVIVHPIVVFGILDHYIRRQEGQERVIGTLLGHLDEETGVVEVSNAYAVPHTESGGEVAVGQAFNKSMFGLLSRVNSEERRGMCAAPVHVVVDASLRDGKGVETAAYHRGPPGADGAAAAFAPVPSSLTFSDGEKVCIDRMIRGQGDEPFATAESLAELPSDADDVRDDFQGLLGQIDEILAYAKKCKSGEVTPDPAVARCIGEALAALPKIEPGVLDGSKNVDAQDIVMVSYLASITKAQLAIAAKIHESF